MSDQILTPAMQTGQTGTDALREQLKGLREHVGTSSSADPAKLRKACQDFEAVFIGQMWKQMRSSVPKEGLLHSKEEENYVSMFDQELSVKMARSGGIGLGDMLYANLSERLTLASRDTVSSVPLNPLDLPKAMQAAVPPESTASLSAATAQREAERLARSIEREHGVPSSGVEAEPLSAALEELEENLRAVSLEDSSGI